MKRKRIKILRRDNKILKLCPEHELPIFKWDAEGKGCCRKCLGLKQKDDPNIPPDPVISTFSSKLKKSFAKKRVSKAIECEIHPGNFSDDVNGPCELCRASDIASS